MRVASLAKEENTLKVIFMIRYMFMCYCFRRIKELNNTNFNFIETSLSVSSYNYK